MVCVWVKTIFISVKRCLDWCLRRQTMKWMKNTKYFEAWTQENNPETWQHVKKKTNICDYANSAVSSLSLQSPSNRSQTETTSTKLNVERATFGFVFLEPTTAPLRHVSYMHLCLSRSETIMSGVLTTCSHFHGNNIINNIACEGRALEGRERLCNHPPPPPEGGLKEDPPLPSAGIRCQHHSPSLK